MESIIYIIDDHELFALGLRSSIERNIENTKVHTFTNPNDLYEFSHEIAPNLIISDFMLSKGNTGLETILRYRAIRSHVKAILISSAKEDRIKELCLENHIEGYVYKSEKEINILKAIQIVLKGQTYYTEEIDLDAVEINKNYDKSNPFSKLTQREMEVVVYLTKGLSYSEIAKVMNISPKTVNNHRVNITEKIGKMSLPHLIMKAKIWGILHDKNLYTDFEK